MPKQKIKRVKEPRWAVEQLAVRALLHFLVEEGAIDESYIAFRLEEYYLSTLPPKKK